MPQRRAARKPARSSKSPSKSQQGRARKLMSLARCPACGASLAGYAPLPAEAIHTGEIIARNALHGGERLTSADYASLTDLTYDTAHTRLEHATALGLIARIRTAREQGGYEYLHLLRMTPLAYYTQDASLARELLAIHAPRGALEPGLLWDPGSEQARSLPAH